MTKYYLAQTEYERLIRFLESKMKSALQDSGWVDAPLPTWYEVIEKLVEKMKAKPGKFQLSLTPWQVKRLGSVRGIDDEFPSLNKFLDEEVNRLIEIGKLPKWLRSP